MRKDLGIGLTSWSCLNIRLYAYTSATCCLVRSFRHAISLEVVSHREVDLKPFIAAIERLLQCSAEDNRNIREAFGSSQIYGVSPAVAIFKVDLRSVSRSDRPVVRQNESGR